MPDGAPAAPAAAGQEREDDVVALLEARACSAPTSRRPRTLVAAAERVHADRHVAGGDVVVGVAQAGRHHLDPDLALTRVVDLEVHDLELAGGLADDRPAGLHAGSPSTASLPPAVHSSARRPWEDLRSVDATPRPRSVRIPRRASERPMTEPFNAAADLTERAGRRGRRRPGGVRHPAGTHHLRTAHRRGATGWRARPTTIGVRPEERVLLCVADDVELAAEHPGHHLPRRGGGAVLDDADGRRAGQARRRLPRPRAAGQPRLRHRGDDGRGGRPRPPPRRAHRRGGPGRSPGSTGLTWAALRDAEPLAAPYAPGSTRRRSGCTPRAPPAGPRRPCTATAAWPASARPTPTRCSASAPTTGATRSPSCSSPTAWGTRCCSRLGRRHRGARARRGPRPRRVPAGPPTRPHAVLRAARRSSPRCWPPAAPGTLRLGARGVSAGEALPRRDLPAVHRPLRRGHHRRAGHHRGAAHLHLQPARQVRPGTSGTVVPGYAAGWTTRRPWSPDGEPGHLLVRATRSPPATGAAPR